MVAAGISIVACNGLSRYAVAPAPGTLDVWPGNAALRVQAITASADTFDLVMQQGATSRRISGVVTRIARTSHPSGPAWVVVQQYESASSSDVDSSLVAAASLAPLRYAFRGGETHDLFFDGLRVIGTVVRGDSVERISLRDTLPFFNAVADRLLLAALPLREGLTVHYRAYNPPARFSDIWMRVDGDTTLHVRGAAIPAWRIEYDAGAAPTVLWVQRSTGRLLQSMSRLPNGATFWRLPQGMQPPDLSASQPGPAARAHLLRAANGSPGIPRSSH